MMNQRINDFIEEQKLATICCIDRENRPYCFSCFYAFDKERTLIYFKSSADTHHAEILFHNPVVAGTIHPDKLNPLAIKGIQFTGWVVDRRSEICFNASKLYHKKYPFALAMPGEVWTIRPEFVKMTDNSLSFGKKIIWKLHETVD